MTDYQKYMSEITAGLFRYAKLQVTNNDTVDVEAVADTNLQEITSHEVYVVLQRYLKSLAVEHGPNGVFRQWNGRAVLADNME